MWASGTDKRGVTSCVLQKDGNLVMYNSAGTPIWNTATNGKDGKHLYLDYFSGELYIYSSTSKKVVWTSKSSKGTMCNTSSGNTSTGNNSYSGNSSTSNNTSASSATAKLIIPGSSNLSIGEKYYSENGAYYLVFQKDGNLVIYTTNGSKVIWASNTDKKNCVKCRIQVDGNFVIYNGANQPIWYTGTDGNQNTDVYLSNSGELFLRSNTSDKIWSSISTSSGLAWPVPNCNNISSYYGYRSYDNSFHKGIDISNTSVMGASIVAADDGTVTYVSNTCKHNYGKNISSYCKCGGGYGNYITIAHSDGTYSTLYGHCQDIYVSIGESVTKEQVIATVGSTGNSSGAHLHFEVLKNKSNSNIDPMSFFR